MPKFRVTHFRLILLLHKTAVTAETHRSWWLFSALLWTDWFSLDFLFRDTIGQKSKLTHYPPAINLLARSCFRLVALSEGGFSDVRHLHPFRVRRSVGFVVV